MEARMNRPRSLVGPAILIAAGGLLLASNLGLMDRNAWNLVFQFWPLILVAAGLDILVRRSSLGSTAGTISLVVLLMVIVGVGTFVTFAAPHMSLSDRGFVVNGERGQLPMMRFGGPVQSESFSQSLEGAERASVDLTLGVGAMDIRAASEAGSLVEGSLMLGEDESVSRDYHVSGDTGFFRLSGQRQSVIHSGGPDGDRNWDLRLNKEIPTNLKVSTGVGRTRMDLSEMRLTGLEINGGVSNTEVILPKAGQFQATINGGVSQIKVLVPRGMEARIQTERGLSSIDVNGNYAHVGNSYVSRNYDGAKDRVNLMIHGGVGKITVQEY